MMKKSKSKKKFTPTTAQLELLAELETAKMPLAEIAARLGVDLAAFEAWRGRLEAHRDFVEPPASSDEILGQVRPKG